jgi:hypothetical protein
MVVKKRWTKRYELDGDRVTLWEEKDGDSVVHYVKTEIDGELIVSSPIEYSHHAHDTFVIMENHILEKYQKGIMKHERFTKGDVEIAYSKVIDMYAISVIVKGKQQLCMMFYSQNEGRMCFNAMKQSYAITFSEESIDLKFSQDNLVTAMEMIHDSFNGVRDMQGCNDLLIKCIDNINPTHLVDITPERKDVLEVQVLVDILKDNFGINIGAEQFTEGRCK